MKLILVKLFTILVIIGCQEQKLIKLTDNQYVELINTNQLSNSDKIKLIDEFGNTINQDSLSLLYRKYDLKETAFVNSNGQVQEIHFKRKDPIEILGINCEHITSKLDSIEKLDQASRNYYNPAVDYSNLQFVISVIETCGMPNNYSELNAIFLVLQHNHSIYQKKYIPLLREKSSQGLIAKSKLALMEDRILMNDGAPQIYGTQVTRKNRNENWKLYDLYEPEKVNYRRKEIGLGPIESYLENFDINFNIEQIE